MTGALGSSLTLLSHLEELHWHILYTSYCLFYNSSLYCFLVAGVFYFRMADVWKLSFNTIYWITRIAGDFLQIFTACNASVLNLY